MSDPFSALAADFTIGGELPPPPIEWEPPEGKTTREWCEEPDPELVEVLGPLLTEGARLVIGGDSGHGKTTLVMQMIHAVATGNECLGMRGCGGPVMILDLEQGKRSMKRRFREAGLDTVNNVMVYRAPDGMNLLSPEQVAWMEDTIEAGLRHQPFRVVVIDPLYKAHEGDSNDERAMVDLMRRLDALRERFGFALVIPMHLRKMDAMQKEPRMADIFGSGGVVRGAEVVVGIQRLPDDASHDAKLYFWKDRDGDLMEMADVPHWNLHFDPTLGFRRGTDDAPVKVTTGQKIIRYLAELGLPATKAQIVDAIGVSRKTVDEWVPKMVEANHIEAAPYRGPHAAKLYGLPGNSIIIDQDGGGNVVDLGTAINNMEA